MILFTRVIFDWVSDMPFVYKLCLAVALIYPALVLISG